MRSWTCSRDATTLEVTQSGFNTFRQTGILLDVDSAKVLNIKLSVGQVSEKVEVSADAVHVETTSTQNGEVISARNDDGRAAGDAQLHRPAGACSPALPQLVRPGGRAGRPVQRHRISRSPTFPAI